MDLKQAIRDFPDFPRPGITFRDITPILQDPAYFNKAISQMEELLKGVEYDIIISPESRGFIFGTPIAARQNKGFVPARKKGKLPGQATSKTYFLEYGMDTIELHTDSIKPGTKAIIVDDLLATGGTAKGVCDIVQELGGEVVRAVFLIELEAIGGRENLDCCEVKAVLKY